MSQIDIHHVPPLTNSFTLKKHLFKRFTWQLTSRTNVKCHPPSCTPTIGIVGMMHDPPNDQSCSWQPQPDHKSFQNGRQASYWLGCTHRLSSAAMIGSVTSVICFHSFESSQSLPFLLRPNQDHLSKFSTKDSTVPHPLLLAKKSKRGSNMVTLASQISLKSPCNCSMVLQSPSYHRSAIFLISLALQ